MDPQIKMIIKKSEAQIIVDALEFTANNVEFKNAYFITDDKIAFVGNKIEKQLKQKPKFLSHHSIGEITSCWK